LEGHDYRVEADTLQEVQAAAKKWLEGNLKLDLKPVILILGGNRTRMSYERESESELQISYERYFVATRKDGEKVWKRWENSGSIPDGDGNIWNDCLEGKPSYTSGCPFDEEESKILPYTPGRWKALRKISKLIRALNIRLDEIINGKDLEGFLEMLEKRDLSLGLPAPAPKVKS
jgi:hypothetical protein